MILLMQDLVLLVLLIGLSVGAWLTWLFVGTIRQWLVALLLPGRWCGRKSRKDIANMSSLSFDDWLSLECECPQVLRKLLSCAACMSFHVCLYHTVIIALLRQTSVFEFGVLLFSSAGVGLMVFKQISRK